ncbi:MAG: amidohydrolase [Terriglobia bacterium]|nr:MAG: amidohydrolase [Terriglobia bacterium]
MARRCMMNPNPRIEVFMRRTVCRLALLAMAVNGMRAQAPGRYLLRDARIVRVSGPVLERGSVVIRNGLIEAVGANLTPPPGAWVIDCNGLTVYPGLIDALSTWGLPSQSGAGGRNGASPAAGPEDRPLTVSWVKAADQIAPSERAIQTARDGGYTTAVVFPRGNIFSGQGAVINMAGERAGQMVVADSVGQFLTLRTSGGRGYPASLLGSIAYVRQIYLDAEHYKTAKAIYEKHQEGLPRPAYDRALEGVLDSSLVLLPAETAIEIERMTALASELKLKAVLYGGHEAWRETELLQQSHTPVLVSLKYPERARDADPALDEPVRVLRLRENAPAAPGALAKAGVPFAFYSDGVNNPRDLMRAVKKAIDAGLAPADAIRALTLTPAEIYGIGKRIGSIDPGKIANLVVTDGDLFNPETKIKYTFVDGNKFEPLPEEPPARPGRGPSR